MTINERITALREEHTRARFMWQWMRQWFGVPVAVQWYHDDGNRVTYRRAD